MLDDETTTTDATSEAEATDVPAPAAKKAAKKAVAKSGAAAKRTAAKRTAATEEVEQAPVAPSVETVTAVKKTAAKKTVAKKAASKKAAAAASEAPAAAVHTVEAADEGSEPIRTVAPPIALFQAPQAPAKKTAKRAAKKAVAPVETLSAEDDETTDDVGVVSTRASGPAQPPSDAHGDAQPPSDASGDAQPPSDAEDEGVVSTRASGPAQPPSDAEGDEQEGDGPRRRRRRGGRRRRKAPTSGESSTDDEEDDEASDAGGTGDEGASEPQSRRRRVRARAGEQRDLPADENVVVKVRRGRSAEDEITGFTGSTRLEAKKQRRREGREAGRRRAPIVTEAEFLARREAVDRVMVVRQQDELTQIAVLEDKVLVEHYVARESQTSLIGNVYLGRVQNVLPSMEAAFVDIGKGRNAVLYAGEVNWEAFGVKDGKDRKIEAVLKSGQAVLVQVTKDPIGHKGARLTSQISLPGRFLVYVPDGTTSGISRKLPDTERNRLKALLKEIVPDSAGVIVRTAAEGASEDELTRDVERLKARWEDISAKVEGGNAPQLLYGEPDLTLKVVRDLFTEDFSKLVVSGDEAWETVNTYVEQVAPDLAERLVRHESDTDAFAAYRIDEQIAKGLDRKVWLPSGGSLIIDRTEAMTVVDVNTGKFTGSGGNLEETVTKNNLEAAEEIVRQLRLRDIGGIIVIDFIDMVLESNRDLVLRRLVECLGRDRTRHQVAEVTSLGLVQMTRKRIGTGLLEAFSETCEHCGGRGLILHHHPVEPKRQATEEEPSARRTRRSRRGRGGEAGEVSEVSDVTSHVPSPADIAAMARHEGPVLIEDHPYDDDDQDDDGRDDDDLTLDAADELAESEVEGGLGDESYDPIDERSDDVDDVDDADPADGVEATTEAGPPVVTTVVTTVRRVGARRAAGPPAAGSEAAEIVIEAVASADAADAAEATEASDADESGEADADDGSAPVHVPVKKKGSRKR